MATFQNTFLRGNQAGQAAPNSNLSAADYVSSLVGASAGFLLGAAGASAANGTLTFATIANGVTKRGMGGQFVSELLTAQSIGAGNWGIGFAAQYSLASATKVWKGWAALYLVNGSTGAIRTTIFGVTDIGSTGRSGTNATTCYNAAVAGGAATATQGDYLVLETGIAITNTSGATITSQFVTATRYSGPTAITVDNTTTGASTPASALGAPAAYTIYVPPAVLAGASIGTSTAGATGLKQTAVLASATVGTSTVGATIGTNQTLPSAASTGTSTAGADLTPSVAVGAVLVGATTGTSAAAATNLSEPQALAGATIGTATVAATALTEPQALGGVSVGTSTASATGSTDQTLPAAGTVGTSTASATGVSLTAALAGESTGTSATAATNMTAPIVLVGGSVGTSTALASNLALAQSLRVALNGDSQPTYATWLNFLAQPVAGASVGTSGTISDLTVLVPLGAAASVGTSTVGATGLAQTQPFVGSVTGTSAALASALAENHALVAGSEGASTVSGIALMLLHALQTSATGDSTASGNLVTYLPAYSDSAGGAIGLPAEVYAALGNAGVPAAIGNSDTATPALR